jgi:hypothetical protein
MADETDASIHHLPRREIENRLLIHTIKGRRDKFGKTKSREMVLAIVCPTPRVRYGSRPSNRDVRVRSGLGCKADSSR